MELNEVNKLRWRCRRGTRELDLLLLNYFDTCFPCAAEAEKEDFRRLLELPDTLLYRYLIQNATPDDTGMAGLVLKIKYL
jgi:antitoxin CptB